MTTKASNELISTGLRTKLSILLLPFSIIFNLLEACSCHEKNKILNVPSLVDSINGVTD